MKNFKRNILASVMAASLIGGQQANAGIFPWDNWIYHLDYKKEEIQQAHRDLVQSQNEIQGEIIDFNIELDSYRTIIASNALLVSFYEAIVMDDVRFSQYTIESDFSDPSDDAFGIALKAGEGVSELVLGLSVGKIIFNFGKMIKNKIFSQSEVVLEDELDGLAELSSDIGMDSASEFLEISSESVGEDISLVASEAVIESATTSSLAYTGIGIFAAIGVDIIFGAIDGAREESELDDQLNKLEDALAKSNSYLVEIQLEQQSINSGVLTEMNRFVDLIDALKDVAGIEPSFSTDFPIETGSISTFTVAQNAAIAQYSVLHDLRSTLKKHLDKLQPGDVFDVDNFITSFAFFETISEQEAQDRWNVLSIFSDDVSSLSPTSISYYADGCPSGTIRMSVTYATENKDQLCNDHALLPPFATVHIGDHSSLSGSQLGCTITLDDPLSQGDHDNDPALCHSFAQP